MTDLFKIMAGMKCLGDVRLVWGDNNSLRMCMIFQWYEDSPDTFGIYLCSNILEMGSSEDFVFEPWETGLPYAIMVETDLVGTVYRHQLGTRLGGVTREKLDSLPKNELKIENGELCYEEDGRIAVVNRPATRVPAGLPVRSRTDPRWQWKEQELDDLNLLVAQFWRDFKW